MTAFSALLGTISVDGVELELGSGLNFTTTGTEVSRNPSTQKIDIPLGLGAEGTGHTIEDNGTPLSQQAALNFIGFTVANTSGRTNITAPAALSVSERTRLFGDGSDGDYTTGLLSMSRNMYFRDLKPTGGCDIHTNGYLIYVSRDFDTTSMPAGAITAVGGAGSAGNSAGGAGAGGVGWQSRMVGGSVSATGAGASSNNAGAQAVAQSGSNQGGASQNSGAGGAGSGGAGGAAQAGAGVLDAEVFRTWRDNYVAGAGGTTATLKAGSPGIGGGGGGGNGAAPGGGGGGGGAGGGTVWISAYNVIAAGAIAAGIQARGGVGGAGGPASNANTGGGGGGSGGGGGEIIFHYWTKSGTHANCLDASGGAGAAGGAGTGSGIGGAGAFGGNSGRITVHNLGAGSCSVNYAGPAGSAGSAAAGTAAGAGGAGGSYQVSV